MSATYEWEDGRYLAEQLADLGRRDKIASLSKGLLVGIVATGGVSVDETHKVGDCQRPAALLCG